MLLQTHDPFRDRFGRPWIEDGVIRLSMAQIEALFEGLELAAGARSSGSAASGG